MNGLRALLLGSCSLLAACGGAKEPALLEDAAGQYRLVAQFDGADAAGEPCLATLRRLGDQAFVFAHDEQLGRDLEGNPRGTPDGRPHDLRLVTIGAEQAEPGPREHGGRTAVVLAQTGAAVAVDMALLWCHGITPPRRLAVGTRVRMPDGTVTTQPAPGDFVLALLRREHADLLTTTPGTDVVFRIGCVLLRADERHLRVQAEALTAAKRYPQVDFVARSADGDPARLEAIVREFLAAGHRAILISADDGTSLGTIAAAAQAQHVALLVLDPAADCEHATCCIGPDQRTLGRAAGEAVRVLAPGGAALVEVAAELQSEAARQRHQGFCDALGLQQRP